jgi:hypothetical protein
MYMVGIKKSKAMPNANFSAFQNGIMFTLLNYLTDCPKPFKALKGIELVLK